MFPEMFSSCLRRLTTMSVLTSYSNVWYIFKQIFKLTISAEHFIVDAPPKRKKKIKKEEISPPKGVDHQGPNHQPRPLCRERGKNSTGWLAENYIMLNLSIFTFNICSIGWNYLFWGQDLLRWEYIKVGEGRKESIHLYFLADMDRSGELEEGDVIRQDGVSPERPGGTPHTPVQCYLSSQSSLHLRLSL